MSDSVIAVSDIVKVFEEGSQRVEVLKGVTLQVAPGEVVALEGPSGSGKTTLLSIMGCILTPTSGRVEVDGRWVDGDPGRLRDVRRRSIGFVFQQYNLFPALSALENVEYALSVKGVRRGARDEAARVLAQVGLGDRLHFLPRDLSGGQKQRVAIARALAGSPPALLADEPTANLDTAAGTQVLRMFRDLAHQEGKGLLIVTHDPKVREVADRVIGIRDGRLVADAEHAEMLAPTSDGGLGGAERPPAQRASADGCAPPLRGAAPAGPRDARSTFRASERQAVVL